ncbi:hypothetical protein T459_31528 [Capsicum annuum]|uniref:Receptor-like protein 12 n=1 Tax=Capsicum annuum TaxID=4072 RepID=A0A2G2YBH7_CAPAN|nr:hypothetical protein T459_31528 [Capsicum annuum]
MWLGTLPELRVLSLRLNKLHGPITTSGSEYMFPELRIFDLSRNDFSKNLPTSLFQHLKAMRTIDQTSKEPRYLGDSYYHDSVMVSTKELELQLLRILTIYTTIDLSNNKFEGYIPSILGDLIALRVLNLSHNGLQGHIPPTLGDLSVVESLDLSGNQLEGEIPAQFASLTFLAFLNLSYNHLEGCIPQGNQFHTFENNSYKGNDKLRGFPLSKGCGNDGHDTYTVSVLDEESNSEILNDFWKAALIGYGTGLCIGLSIIYILISTGNMKWLERIVEALEHKTFFEISIARILCIDLENFETLKPLADALSMWKYITTSSEKKCRKERLTWSILKPSSKLQMYSQKAYVSISLKVYVMYSQKAYVSISLKVYVMEHPAFLG